MMEGLSAKYWISTTCVHATQGNAGVFRTSRMVVFLSARKVWSMKLSYATPPHDWAASTQWRRYTRQGRISSLQAQL